MHVAHEVGLRRNRSHLVGNSGDEISFSLVGDAKKTKLSGSVGPAMSETLLAMYVSQKMAGPTGTLFLSHLPAK